MIILNATFNDPHWIHIYSQSPGQGRQRITRTPRADPGACGVLFPDHDHVDHGEGSGYNVTGSRGATVD